MTINAAPKLTFLILLSGALTVTERLRAQVAGARVIAADDGIRHAETLGLTPELWVGDFDSADQQRLDRWSDIPRDLHPVAKNDTDGGIATAAALARGAKRLILAGALAGERSDHLVSHVVHAASLVMQGIDVLMTSGEEEGIPLLPGTRTVDLPGGSLFSIIGLDDLGALSISGARYPLDRHEAAFGSTRTISNVADGPITISHEAGRALLLARPFDLSGA